MPERGRDTTSTILVIVLAVVVLLGLLSVLQWGISLLRRLIFLVALVAVAVIIVIRKGDR